MARLLRFLPDNATLVEVTTRTIQSRLLLTPTPQLNRIIIGALARAGRRYEVGVVAFSFLSNHFHLLVRVKDAEQLANFMGLFNSKLAREVVRLTGWKDKVWSRRYQATVVSNEDAAQTARLSYVLSNGVKENLVARVSEWPGVHAAPALLAGTALEGIWVNRTAEYLAKQRGETPRPRGASRTFSPKIALPEALDVQESGAPQKITRLSRSFDMHAK
jgi:putative transposase